MKSCMVVAGAMGLWVVVALDAGARSVDLEWVYFATHTLIPAYNPDLAPDMDGDGYADLTEQVSIQTLLQVLGDELHAEHAATLAAFEHNEALAVAPLVARWGPQQSLIPYLGELCAVYMTIQGEGTFAGPTRTGMAGRVEELWVMLSLADYGGSFESQSWQQAPIFAPEPIVPALAVSGDGVVTEGDTVVFTASPTDALAYRWFKDSTLIVGEAASALTLDPVTLDDAGEYYCEFDMPDKATYTTPTVVLVVQAQAQPESLGVFTPWAAALAVACLALVATSRFTSLSRRGSGVPCCGVECADKTAC